MKKYRPATVEPNFLLIYAESPRAINEEIIFKKKTKILSFKN